MHDRISCLRTIWIGRPTPFLAPRRGTGTKSANSPRAPAWWTWPTPARLRAQARSLTTGTSAPASPFSSANMVAAARLDTPAFAYTLWMW